MLVELNCRLMPKPASDTAAVSIAVDPVDEASLAEAGKMLRKARRLLVMGLGGVSTEAQRVAVAIADRLGGVADWTTAPSDAAAMIAMQTVGAVGATYGEAAQRADLVLYWGMPEVPLPGFDRIGDAASREVLEVGGASFPLAAGADYEALHILRAILAGVEVAGVEVAGADLALWKQLADKLTAANYVVIVPCPSLAKQGPATLASLTQLAQQLHATTRVAVVTPPSDDNRLGAENVLTWQTGAPLAVDFAAGYPRYGPGEFDAATLLERAEADAVLLVDNRETARLSDAARKQLRSTPRVVLTGGSSDETAEFLFETPSLKAARGTYYRGDGLALLLRGEDAIAETILKQLLEQIASEPS